MLPERFETAEEAVQAYLDSIIGPYRKLVEADRKLKRIQKLIDSGKATYSDGHDYAIRCGQLLKSVLGNVFDAADFPDGIFDYDLAKGIFPPAFRQNYEVISSGCSMIQESLNERAGLGIKAQIPEYNQDRAFGIAKKVSSDLFEKTAWVLGEPVINASQSIVDDSVKKNVDFQYEAGLHPKIVRTMVGGCCKWCSNLAGEYDYPDGVPADVFKRHQHCRCEVTYRPGDGRRQDVWSKLWKESPKDIQHRERYNGVVGERSGRNRTNQKGLEDHFQRHAEDMGITTLAEYVKKANDLWNEPLSDDVEEFERSDEALMCFKHSTGEFSVIENDGRIRTYFIPDDPEGYWEKQIFKYS